MTTAAQRLRDHAVRMYLKYIKEAAPAATDAAEAKR